MSSFVRIALQSSIASLLLAGCASREDAAPPAKAPAKAPVSTTGAGTAKVAAPTATAAVSTTAPGTRASPFDTCAAYSTWVSAPNPPAEIGGPSVVPVADETNCQFYQFAWQWFLQEVSPSSAAPDADRVFETHRLFQPDVPKQCSTAAVTGRKNAIRELLVRTRQVADNSLAPVSPTEFENAQADGAALYDRNGNVVLYNMWYTANECQPVNGNFQPGTQEIKTSWRQLTPADDASTYYTMTATVPDMNQGKPMTLGLVGFHLVSNTALHPEFVWATFEHESNAPLCDTKTVAPTGGWSFASAAAADCLNNSGLAGCSQYAFNTAAPAPQGGQPFVGTPNQVCELFPDGTDPEATAPNTNDNALNAANIDAVNTQIVGPTGFLTTLPKTDAMAVWKNYTLVGGLWTNGGVASGENPVPYTQGGTVMPASTTSPQRGSLELTNTTMETFEQGSTSPIPNCFSCHTYAVAPANPLNVSHIACALLGPDMASVDCPTTTLGVKKPATGAKK